MVSIIHAIDFDDTRSIRFGHSDALLLLTFKIDRLASLLVRLETLRDIEELRTPPAFERALTRGRSSPAAEPVQASGFAAGIAASTCSRVLTGAEASAPLRE